MRHFFHKWGKWGEVKNDPNSYSDFQTRQCEICGKIEDRSINHTEEKK